MSISYEFKTFRSSSFFYNQFLRSTYASFTHVVIILAVLFFFSKEVEFRSDSFDLFLQIHVHNPSIHFILIVADFGKNTSKYLNLILLK